MLRKSALAFILLPLSATCWSTAGFYIGAGVGPDLVDFHQKSRIIRPGLSDAFHAIDKTHLSGRGVFGTLFAGYGWQYERFYLAGEVNGNLSSAQFSSSNQELLHVSYASTHYKMRRNYGVSVLPGFVFTDTTMFYGRLGYVKGNFRTNTSDSSLVNVNRNLDGFRTGLGIKQGITQHFSVRLEYDYIDYEHTKFTAFDNMVTKTTRIKPSTNQVEFGLVYDFDCVEKVATK